MIDDDIYHLIKNILWLSIKIKVYLYSLIKSFLKEYTQDQKKKKEKVNKKYYHERKRKYDKQKLENQEKIKAKLIIEKKL